MAEQQEFMNPALRLAAYAMLSSAFTVLYLFGDSIQLLQGPGNLDVLLVPAFGIRGYYAFEVAVPGLQLLFMFLALRQAYGLGASHA